jgi:integrase
MIEELRGKGENEIEIESMLAFVFYLKGTKIRSEKTRIHYRRSVKRLEDMLGRKAVLSDLTRDSIVSLMTWLRDNRGNKPDTVNTSRKYLVAVWQWAFDAGITNRFPRVDKAVSPKRTPKAFTVNELERLMDACGRIRGETNGMKNSVLLKTVIALVMDTGARAGELFSFRWEWIDWSGGWIHVPAEYRKRKEYDAEYGLLDDTLAWLKSFKKDYGPIFNCESVPGNYYDLWDQLLREAGIQVNRRNKTQCLRRTFATLIEAGGGHAPTALGVKVVEMVRKHYLDPSMIDIKCAEKIPFRTLSLGKDGKK